MSLEGWGSSAPDSSDSSSSSSSDSHSWRPVPMRCGGRRWRQGGPVAGYVSAPLGSLGRLVGEGWNAFSRDIVYAGHQSNSQKGPWMQQAPILRGRAFSHPRPVVFSNVDKVCRTRSKSLQSLCGRQVPLPREEWAQDEGLWKLPGSPGRHWGTDQRIFRLRCCWPMPAFGILWLLGYG